jgi:mycothiol synthase
MSSQAAIPDLRGFRGDEADYAALAALIASQMPDERQTVAEIRDEDDSIAAAGRWMERLVIDESGDILGQAMIRELVSNPAPGRLLVDVTVRPDRERNGFGSRLFAALLEKAAARAATELVAEGTDRLPGGVRFAERHGFEELQREWAMELDLAAARSAGAGADPSGIAIRTLADMKRADPAWAEHLHALHVTLETDVPSDLAFVAPPLDVFRRTQLEAAGAIHEAYFVALDGDRWVGLSELRRRLAVDDVLEQHLTGVLRTHRRRGIAQALKERGIDWARANGYRRIRTGSSTRNVPMLTLNERLGFRRGQAWIVFRRSL